MKKSMKKTAAVALTGVLAAGLLSGCGEAKLDGTKAVATVDGTSVPMGVLSLAVRSQQANLEYMYSYYIQAGYMSSLWDQTVDEDSEETYGQQTVSSVLDQVELMYLLKSHAGDYGVEVTADDEKAIADAAAQFMADNTEEAIQELAVTEDQVKEYLELLTYSERMEHAIEADADVEVSDEEAQQSGFTYVLIPLDEEVEEAEEDADAEAEETETEDADAEAEEAETEDAEAETKDADAEAETEEADAEAEAEEDAEEDAEDTVDALTKAEELLKAMQEDASADMTEVAQTIDESLTSYTGTFAANVSEEEDSEEEEDDYSYSSYPDELLEALRGLQDGELVNEVITTDNGYYVARLDQVFDEEATESEKDSIISERQHALYEEVTEGWKDAAEIKVDDKVLATLKLTDSHTFTLKTEEVTEDESEDDIELVDEDDIEDAEILDDVSDAPETVDAENPEDETDTETETDTEDEAASADDDSEEESK